MKLVVKIGGSLMKEGRFSAIISDVPSIMENNTVVLVHGGGEFVTDIATRLGHEQKFIVSPSGMRSRYTDRETADIYQMVMSGLLAKQVVSQLARSGVRGFSVSGTDGGLLRGIRKKRLVTVDERGRKVAVEGGYTGKVAEVDSSLVTTLLDAGLVPVVSPVAVGEETEPLNLDGDRAASSIAQGIGADVVIFATDVDGLSMEGALVPHLTPAEAESMLPNIGFGMQKKVIAAAEAVKGGVGEAIICSGSRAAPLTAALSHLGCTVVSDR